ncbi:uncharacterized protein NPIL_450251 [Nephila pilipes]|uniref:Uncharacterized protein n=1 Tax=Nephila pilipes TaxID=299642 RepID=A0A8X6N2Z4_NEPPI|nr:uncharacterized protein NPIL_450251 [Nephila pilipes]
MIHFTLNSTWIGYHHKMDAIGPHKKDILDYFSSRLNAVAILMYGVKQSRSRIFFIGSSKESIVNYRLPTKRRIPVRMPHDSTRKKNIRHKPESTVDRSHRS